jgi:hypothetical protein
MGPHEGQRFPGLPQLPQPRRHERRGSTPQDLRPPREGQGRGQDLHRLPQGHRPPATQGIRGGRRRPKPVTRLPASSGCFLPKQARLDGASGAVFFWPGPGNHGELARGT